MKKYIFLFTIMIALITSNVFIFRAHAADGSIVDQIKFENINPDRDILYKIKRVKEKLSEIVTKQFNKSNIGNYYLDASGKRLAEYAYIIRENKMGQIETSSSRYVSFIGMLSENTNSLNIDKAKNKLSSHVEILQELSYKYNYDTAEWMFVQQALESAKVLLSNISS